MSLIHFNQILVFSPITHTQMTWTDEADQQASGLVSPQYWQDVAKRLEAGGFDGVFFADTLSLADREASEARRTMEAGALFPRMDPFALIPYMAMVTSHLGFGATLSTAGTPPFLAARRLATLDNMTGGRVAWNVVTSHVKSDYDALGLTQPDHDTRYDVADEYMEICYRLWDGFPRDALVMDAKRRVFVDASKISRVAFSGKYLNCDAYPVTMCSPQGRPLIFQAGQSGRGLEFAATHADAIYALQSRLESMKAFVCRARETTARLDRKRDPRIFFGLQPIIGGTEAEARARAEALKQRVPLDVAMNRLGAMIGVDLAKHDPDKPLEDISTEASRGILMAVLDSIGDRAPTVREAALHWGVAYGSGQVIGTPEQVADEIERHWRESGCYGFNISPTNNPASVIDFVEEVAPILRKRGLMRSEYAGTTYRQNLDQQS
jgi:FMN-dependent oxidoreductase (nitrilotriacetate monooxygenase family)